MVKPAACVRWARVLASAAAYAGAAWSGAASGMWPPDGLQAGLEIHRAGTPEGLAIAPAAARVRATAGVPAALYFRTQRPAPITRIVHAEPVNPGVVRVLEHGQIGPDAELGCAIVEGIVAGTTVVRIGGAPIQVEVAPRGRGGPGGFDDQPDRLLAPVDGAAVWGRVSIGASWWRGTERGAVASSPALVVDGYPDRGPLPPKWVSPESDGPLALASFDLDVSEFPPGPLVLRLVREGDAPESAQTIRLRVFHPEPDGSGPAMLLAGECEATYDLPELPPERRERQPTIRKDAKASGGAYFDAAGSTPRFRFPVEVPSELGSGWYQVIVTAAGDRACGVWPAVGVTVDEAQYPLTRSSIATGDFHRVPIGTPIRLEAGLRVLRLDFLNDFYVGGAADRNLRLDRIEVLRVADAGPGGAEAPAGPAMMMSGGAGDESGGMMAMRGQEAGGGGMMAMSGGGMRSGGTSLRWPENVAQRDRGRSVSIALARALDGAVIAGDLEVRGTVTWPGMGQKDRPAPMTRLSVNGESLGTQFAASPRYVVPWRALLPPPHENVIELATDQPGLESASTIARVRRSQWQDDSGAPAARAGPLARFTVHDPRWAERASERIVTDQGGSERLCFGLFSPGDLVLHLPEDLQGRYELEVEARGQHFQGAPELVVSLETDGQLPPHVLDVLAVPTGWDAHALQGGVPADKRRSRALALLGPGPKALRLTFHNDLYEPDKGDRNVFIQAVALREVRDDLELPVGGATMIHPAAGQELAAGGADTVIFEPLGPTPLHTAEVLIDGQPAPFGAAISLRGRPGPYLVPLSLRGVAPGRRTLQVRVTDMRGRAATSDPTEVIVADLAEPSLYQRAVALLNRFAFGPDERELIAVLTLGERAYLDQRLADGPDSPRVRPAILGAAARYPGSSSAGDVQRRAILETLTTANPVRARFVLWAENHFSTWIRKTEPRRKAEEHDRFTRLGVAAFPDLLLASATSPAMLRYLDQEQSFSRRLNENYAREIMELHTLGVHGGYTQDDVTSLARILTGWTTAREPYLASAAPGADPSDGVGPDEYGMREAFRFDPALSDGQDRVFLGRTLARALPEHRHKRVLGAMAMLAWHPSTARFISGKIAAHYAAFPPEPGLVEELASAFTRASGDMAEVLRTLATHEAFRTSAAAGDRLAHPPDFALRLARAAGSTDAQAVHDYLNLSGRGMFDRSTPDGYQDDDAESMDSNAVLQRWKFARRLENPLMDLLPAGARAGDKPIADAEAQAIVDLVMIRLTGRLPGQATSAAAMDLLRGVDGRREDRLRTLVVFLASTPEAQLK